MARRPGYASDTGAYTGLEDQYGFEDYGTEDWEGTALADPTALPDPIEGDWGFNFRPASSQMQEGDPYQGYVDWATGEGIDPLPITSFNDLQYTQAFGQRPDEPSVGPDPYALQEAGYTFGFDPADTAQRNWALDYDIYNPEGMNTGWALSSQNPYDWFPWVGGVNPFGEAPVPPPPGDDIPSLPGDGNQTPYGDDMRVNTIPDTVPTAEELCAASGGTWNGFECVQSVSGVQSSGDIVRPQTDLPPDWFGDIEFDPSSIPFQPTEFTGAANVPVGTDPLSMLTNANLGSLLTTGGVAPTPLAGNVEQSLQDVLANQGVGGEAVSPLGQQAGSELSQMMATQGQLRRDAQRDAMEIEAARSPLDVLRRAQLSEGAAALANRGLVGSGVGQEYGQRLEERLAPQYTAAAQQLELDRRQREDQRYQQAVQGAAQMSLDQAQRRENRFLNAVNQATGMSQEQSRNVLATARTVNERQGLLNDMALGVLDRNMQWNRFLAEYGLERSQVIDTIQSGRINAILPLLQQYLSGVSTAAGGYAVED